MSIPPVAGNVTEDDWNRFKDTIRKLYLDDNRKLEGPEGVRNEMRTYNFRQTKAQYERHFRSWGWRKNNNAKRWQLIARKVLKRKRDGKESNVCVGGDLLPAKKLRKEVQRYGKQDILEALSDGDVPSTPESIVVFTPREEQLPTCGVIFELPLLQYLKRFTLTAMHAFESSGRPPPAFDFYVQAQSQNQSDVLQAPKSLATLPALPDSSRNVTVESSNWSLTGRNADLSVLTDHKTENQLATALNDQTELVQFLKTAIIAISNNLLSPDLGVTGRILHMLQIGNYDATFEGLIAEEGPTAECLAEKLFPLALEARSVRLVSALATRGVNVNNVKPLKTRDESLTALGLACRVLDADLVRVLLNNGANVNSQERVIRAGNQSSTVFSPLSLVFHSLSKDHESPTYASTHMDIVQELLRRGANPDGHPGDRVPLVQVLESRLPEDQRIKQDRICRLGQCGHQSCMAVERHAKSSRLMIKGLISAGARFDGNDFVGAPLDKAASMGDFETFHFLLSYGSHPTGSTLHRAIEGKCRGMIDIVMRYRTEEQCTDASRSCLVSAAKLDDEQLFKSILNCGLVNRSVDVLAKAAETAAEALFRSIVPMLFDACASDPASRDKFIPVMNRAVELRDYPTVAYLLEVGVSATSESLRLAILHLSEPIISALFEADVSVNASDCLNFVTEPSASSSQHETNSTCWKCSYPRAPLTEAAKGGDHLLIKQLLQKGARLPGTDALVEAITFEESIQTVKMLLAAGANVNDIPPSACFTPLQKAVDRGFEDIVQLLLESGADPNQVVEQHVICNQATEIRSPLAIAVSKGHDHLVCMLLNAGADINFSIDDGVSAPLSIALGWDVSWIVEFLLKNGADPENSQAILHATMHLNKTALLLISLTLVSKAPPRKVGFGNQALCFAIEHDLEDIVIRLLELGADHSVDQDGVRINTAMKYAIDTFAKLGPKYVTKLLKAQVDPNRPVEGFNPSLGCAQTPLLRAIGLRSVPLMELLIRSGANPNQQTFDDTTRTPLQAACETTFIDAIQLLLDCGADVNAPPALYFGATAVQFASLAGNVDIANLLIDKGADINAPAGNINGRTALEGAAEHGRIDMIGLLLQRGVLTEGPWERQYLRALDMAERNGHLAVKRYLEAAVSQRREAGE